MANNTYALSGETVTRSYWTYALAGETITKRFLCYLTPPRQVASVPRAYRPRPIPPMQSHIVARRPIFHDFGVVAPLRPVSGQIWPRN